MRLRRAAMAACLGAFVLGAFGFRHASPARTSGTLPVDPPAPYLRFSPPDAPLGTALLIHGLNANKELMQTFARALADSGFEAYAIDLPGHGDSTLDFSYAASLETVERAADWVPGDPVLIGHSLGGALLLELAGRRPYPVMLLLSPPPMAVERLEVGRMLVATGSLEAPRVAGFAPHLVEAAGGRGEWWNFPDAGHSTALFDPAKLDRFVRWLGADASRARTLERFGWLGLMAAAGIAGFLILAGMAGTGSPRRDPARAAPEVLVEYVVTAAAAVLALAVVVPLRWLNLFATDYLMSLVLLAGLLLWRGRGLGLSRRAVAVASLCAAYVVAAFGIGIGSQLVHAVPSGDQWLRFPFLAAAAFPLFLHDERTLRGITPGWKRLMIFLTTRAVLWAAVVTGVLLLSTEAAFLVLIMHLVVSFWLVLWWMSGVVARVSSEPGAAALFAALVQGWVFAALFVTI